MPRSDGTDAAHPPRATLIASLKERGVLRVAASYAVIAWLLLQIASVIFDPLGVPKWVMTALIVAAAIGFPVALVLAWFLEIGEHGVEIDTAAAGVARPTARGLRHYADMIVIGVLLVAVAVLLVRQSRLERAPAAGEASIAVLPFDNLSGDPQQEYFSDGLAEEMLDRLGRVPGLHVIGRSSSFSFKGQNVDSRTIARRLDVATLLEGSVRRDGRRLRLSARLIDGATGRQKWSATYDREMTDVFAVQSELAQAVVDAIFPRAPAKAPEGAAAPTKDLSAYDRYLLARSQLVLRLPHSMARAAEYAGQAVAADPGFAQAQALLATALVVRYGYDDESPPEERAAWLARAEAAARRAVELDPGLSEAHQAYGNVLRELGRPGAEEQYKRALELNPSNALAWHDYAVYLSNTVHRPQDSLRATGRALELDPRLPATWANYLPHLIEPGGERYRKELERAFRQIGDMPFALDRILLPGASVAGYPVEILRGAELKRKVYTDDDLPLWINCYRAWLAVDVARAGQCLPEQGERRHGFDYEPVRLFMKAEVAGLQGRWTQVDQALAEAAKIPEPSGPWRQSVAAFWLAARADYGQAASALERGMPIQEASVPPLLGGDASYGLMEAAQLRIYRATGRPKLADDLAATVLGRLRRERQAVGAGCQYEGSFWGDWIRYASIAATEGLKDEAVDALRGAMRCGDLPVTFQPTLPWFRALEGYAPYDELLRERRQRVTKAREEMLRLEAREAGTPGTEGRPQ